MRPVINISRPLISLGEKEKRKKYNFFYFEGSIWICQSFCRPNLSVHEYKKAQLILWSKKGPKTTKSKQLTVLKILQLI